jgi:hypothetical protein
MPGLSGVNVPNVVAPNEREGGGKDESGAFSKTRKADYCQQQDETEKSKSLKTSLSKVSHSPPESCFH